MSSNGPIDDEPAPLEVHARRERDPNDERRLQRSQQNRLYRESHPEQTSATRRRWVDANRDRVREYGRRWRADNLERARELNRESNRRVALRRKKEAELRASARKRAKRWRESHIDEVRIYRARWANQNPDKVRAYRNDYYHRHRDEINERAAARRDANQESMDRARKAWAERNKERLAELQRARRRDPGSYQAQLRANAAARRLKRRLHNFGLPPRQLHPATAAERRTNEKLASAYFNNPGLTEHVRQTDILTEKLTKHVLDHGHQMRAFAESYLATRERMGLPLIAVEQAVWARAVEFVLSELVGMDLLTSWDIAAAVRSSKATVWRAEREQQWEALVRSTVAYANRHRGRLETDVVIENQARCRVGKPQIAAEALVVRFALQEVSAQVPTDHLTLADIRRAYHVSKLRDLASSASAHSLAGRNAASSINSESTMRPVQHQLKAKDSLFFE